MATSWETFSIPLTGGLITNVGRLEQGLSFPGSATKLQNYEPSVEGGYSKVRGYIKFAPTAVPGTGLIRGILAIGPVTCLALRASNYQFYDGTVWVNKGTVASGVSRIDSEVFNFNGETKTVIVDGVNKPVFFNHVTSTLVRDLLAPTEATGASQVAVFKNHVFFAKDNLLSFTAPFEETNYAPGDGAGVVNVGDSIVALKVFREQLIIFCRDRIKRVVGNTVDDFQLLEITDKTGCLDAFTVQEVGGDLMYLGPDGVRYFSATEKNNDFGLNRASEAIQKDVALLIASNTQFASVTLSSKNQYRLFSYVANTPDSNSQGLLATKFSNQTTENIQWAKLLGFKVNVIHKYQSVDEEVVLFCNSTGFVYRMESGFSLDGGKIESILELPYAAIRDSKIRKTIYKHTAYMRPVGPFSLDTTLKFDYEAKNSSKPASFEISGGNSVAVYGASTSIYGTSLYGSTVAEEYFNNTSGSGFVVSVNYYEKSTNPSFNINFVILEFRENERR